MQKLDWLHSTLTAVPSSNHLDLRTSLLRKMNYRQRQQLRKVALILAVIVVLSVIAWTLLNTGCGPDITLVPTGTVLSIQPGQHSSYSFTITTAPPLGTSRPIYMTLSANNGVVLYIMTPSQFTTYNSTNASSSYVWTSGQATSINWPNAGRVLPQSTVGVSTGPYYLVFANPNTSLTTTVTVSQQILLSC